VFAITITKHSIFFVLCREKLTQVKFFKTNCFTKCFVDFTHFDSLENFHLIVIIIIDSKKKIS
jgi:hypothetical protein